MRKMNTSTPIQKMDHVVAELRSQSRTKRANELLDNYYQARALKKGVHGSADHVLSLLTVEERALLPQD